jgi:large subunit ribosomal protein L15
MKLHDLKPAEGARTERRRLGRGIAAGQGKTAGRGTKGQKARAGGSIPPWFEGGQTPLHMRIPKLRGFKNRLKIEYEVVNVGRIAELAQMGAFETGEAPTGKKSGKPAPITINQEILRAVGLVRTLDRPMKVLGQGDVEVALFVVADAFSKSAVAKVEAAGGSVQVLEIPPRPLPALGVAPADEGAAAPPPPSEAVAEPPTAATATATPASDRAASAASPEATAEMATSSESSARPRRTRATAPAAEEPGSVATGTGEDVTADATVTTAEVATAAAEPSRPKPARSRSKRAAVIDEVEGPGPGPEAVADTAEAPLSDDTAGEDA